MENYFCRDPETGQVLPDRRTGVDRRSPTTLSAIFSSPFRRRKSKGRRKTDPGAYVDLYDARTWFIAVAIIVLSGLDAVLTAQHMQEGTARELNPLMNAIIQRSGLPAFYAAKAAMTVIPLAVIFVHKEWALGRFAAKLCLLAYFLLCLYHTVLLLQLRS